MAEANEKTRLVILEPLGEQVRASSQQARVRQEFVSQTVEDMAESVLVIEDELPCILLLHIQTQRQYEAVQSVLLAVGEQFANGQLTAVALVPSAKLRSLSVELQTFAVGNVLADDLSDRELLEALREASEQIGGAGTSGYHDGEDELAWGEGTIATEFVDELGIVQDLFAFGNGRVSSRDEQIEFSLSGPATDKNEWRALELDEESGQPRWLFCKKNRPETDDVLTGWVFYGEKPRNVSDEGEWLFASDSPRLVYFNKDRLVGAKIDFNNDVVLIAADSQHAKTYLALQKNQLMAHKADDGGPKRTSDRPRGSHRSKQGDADGAGRGRARRHERRAETERARRDIDILVQEFSLENEDDFANDDFTGIDSDVSRYLADDTIHGTTGSDAAIMDEPDDAVDETIGEAIDESIDEAALRKVLSGTRRRRERGARRINLDEEQQETLEQGAIETDAVGWIPAETEQSVQSVFSSDASEAGAGADTEEAIDAAIAEAMRVVDEGDLAEAAGNMPEKFEYRHHESEFGFEGGRWVLAKNNHVYLSETVFSEGIEKIDMLFPIYTSAVSSPPQKLDGGWWLFVGTDVAMNAGMADLPIDVFELLQSLRVKFKERQNQERLKKEARERRKRLSQAEKAQPDAGGESAVTAGVAGKKKAKKKPVQAQAGIGRKKGSRTDRGYRELLKHFSKAEIRKAMAELRAEGIEKPRRSEIVNRLRRLYHQVEDGYSQVGSVDESELLADEAIVAHMNRAAQVKEDYTETDEYVVREIVGPVEQKKQFKPLAAGEQISEDDLNIIKHVIRNETARFLREPELDFFAGRKKVSAGRKRRQNLRRAMLEFGLIGSDVVFGSETAPAMYSQFARALQYYLPDIDVIFAEEIANDTVLVRFSTNKRWHYNSTYPLDSFENRFRILNQTKSWWLRPVRLGWIMVDAGGASLTRHERKVLRTLLGILEETWTDVAERAA